MRQESKDFLIKYLNNSSPTGFESTGQEIWIKYLRPYVDDVFNDVYGTAVGVINPGMDYKFVLEAHADEISWFVHYIDDNGYLYVKKNGGSDVAIAPSMRVNIYTKNGIVNGVFGWPPMHHRDPNEILIPKLENIFIDIGAKSKEEVINYGVYVGCVITYKDGYMELGDNYLTSRALDNRIGGFIIAEVGRLIKENEINLPFSLYFVNSVQEEVGSNGAKMIANRIKPNLAICIDVTHDTSSPMDEKKKFSDIQCSKGPVVVYGPAVHNKLLDSIIDIAKENNIPFQRFAVSGSTSTDTDSFAYSGEGVVSALIKLPLKYMHTSVETINKNDVDHLIKLLYEFIIQFNVDFDFNYLKLQDE